MSNKDEVFVKEWLNSKLKRAKLILYCILSSISSVVVLLSPRRPTGYDLS